MTTAFDSSTRQAQDQIATVALSLFQLHGYPAPGSDVLGNIINSAMAGVSASELRSSSAISSAAISIIDQLVVGTVEAGKPRNIYSADAARAALALGTGLPSLGGGLDRFDPARPINARYREASGDGGASGGTERSTSSARYDAVGVTDWTTPKGLALTRGYAVANDMGWVTKQPDLMRMGQPAIAALHDANLRGDGYDCLHSKEHLNFDNKTIVEGAEYMKRNGLNYNEAAKADAKVYDNKALSSGERSEWRDAVGRIHHSKDSQSDETARNNLREKGSHIKQNHPEMTPDVDRALKENGASTEERLKTESKAALKVTAAAINENAAHAKPKQVVTAQTATAKSKASLDAALN